MILNHNNRTCVAHLNSQSILYSFDEFHLMLTTYQFDIITLSEKWLRNNEHVINYVRIPGYNLEHRDRDTGQRGGGVGFYIKENLDYKLRQDLGKHESSIEQQWIEVKGKNKNSPYLVGVFYQPSQVENLKNDWLDKFENDLQNVSMNWDGVVIITGDFNIDLINSESVSTKRYKDILETFSLLQHVSYPTRNGSTLIDHISSNIPNKIVCDSVIPCDEISDHDAPFVIFNIAKTKFQKRYKWIRDEKKL